MNQMGIAFRTARVQDQEVDAQEQVVNDLEVAFLEWICGAFEGTVTDTTGEPVVGAIVKVIDQVSGDEYLGLTDLDGFYAICVPANGGPYTIQVLCCPEGCCLPVSGSCGCQ